MLSSSNAAKLIHKIDSQLRKLVTYEGNFPNTNSSQEVAACQMYLAQEVCSRAATHLKVAREAAIIEGVIIDADEHPLKAKENKQLYCGEHVNVFVTVNEGSVTYPHAALRAEMVKFGMAKDDIDKIFKAAKKTNKNAHKFISTLALQQRPDNGPTQVKPVQQSEQAVQ